MFNYNLHFLQTSMITYSISFYCNSVTVMPKVPDKNMNVSVNGENDSQPCPLNNERFSEWRKRFPTFPIECWRNCRQYQGFISRWKQFSCKMITHRLLQYRQHLYGNFW
ncbi:unnamed protein product [Coregonus sp. 'balchen']|nr:unnamed protein product [Coregonus sp. 'balchen']